MTINTDLLFPIIFLYSENPDKFLYFTDTCLNLIVYIQQKLNKNKD